MKVCLKEFPKGSYKNQAGDGFYMDNLYRENLKIMAKNITNDMQFFAICSAKGIGVRVGKSAFMQQTGSAWCELVNELHGTDLNFSMKNVVFRAKDLITRAFELPPYSMLVLDEGDDTQEHYWSKVAKDLRRFFRKCGQLNLFIILITPNFFELSRGYAIIRSNFLVLVKFEGEFQRGHFEFYSYKTKKNLFLMGKKFMDYDCVRSDFQGQFPNLYTVNKVEYDKAKMEDLKDEAGYSVMKTPKMIELETSARIACTFRKLYPDLTIAQIAEGVGVHKRTVDKWIHIAKEKGFFKTAQSDFAFAYNNDTIDSEQDNGGSPQEEVQENGI